MPAKSYLQQNLGRLRQVAATVVSTGAANGGDIVALTDAGTLDQSLMPAGIGPTTITLPASEAIGAGKLVNIYASGGVATARLADASVPGKGANGYAPAGVASGANVTIYTGGSNAQAAGLTAGGDVFLSASSPGGVTPTAPSGSGQVVQRVGTATSATAFSFTRGLEVELV